MQYDYRELLGRITTMCGTQQNFAKAMGRSERIISSRLNNKAEWSQKDMLKAAKVLQFENGAASIPKYFFVLKVQS